MKPYQSLALFLAAGLCAALAGCGSSGSNHAPAEPRVAADRPAPPTHQQAPQAMLSAEAPAMMMEAPSAMQAPAPRAARPAPRVVMEQAPPPRPAFGNVRPDIRLGSPAGDVELPRATKRTTALLGGDGREFFVEFGPDPVVGGGGVNAVATDGGTGWKLNRDSGSRNFGFSYLTGYWRLFETERTRTITWGGINSGAGRVLPAGDGLPERDQIFIFCGGADVSAVDDPGGSKIKVTKGQYVTATTSGGKVVISAPQPFPTRGMRNPPADAESIISFIEAMRAAHPDPCNP